MAGTAAILLLLAGLAARHFLVSPAPSNSPQALFRQAEEAITDRDYSLAIANLNQCLESWPFSAETHFLLARTCRRAGRLRPAKAHLDRAAVLQWPQQQIRLERQLRRAQTGNVWTVEQSLLDRLNTVLQEKNETITEKYAYQETVLEKLPEKKPTRLRRAYDLAEVTKGDDKQTLPYQGKTVLIEKKGERYQFQIEGGEELTGNDAEFLEKEFNRKKGDELDFEKILIPKKPVRVQESWELDTDALCKDLEKASNVEVDRARSKAIAKLVKAYQQSGRQFGIIDVHLEFQIKAVKMGEVKISLDPAVPYVADATMDACIDGSLNGGALKFTIHLDGQGELAQGEMKFKLTFKTNINGQETQKELAQK
jgi:tetratricopeptide (TPR) repeat protein